MQLFLSTIPDMARPRKHGELSLDHDLRIPVTVEQKEVIRQAVADEPEGMAAWARAVLLRAARSRLAKAKIRREKQK